MTFGKPSVRMILGALACMLILWACHLTNEEAAFMNVSADTSWTQFDSIQVILQDEDGKDLETLFHGELTSPGQLRKLRTKGYDGGKVKIAIIGFNDDKVAKTESRTFDGSTGLSGDRVVVIPPKDTIDPIDPKDSTVLDIKPDALTLYTGGPDGSLMSVGTEWAGKALAWSSLDSTTAIVDAGKVKPVAAGKAWILAVSGANRDSSEITVVTDAPVLETGSDTVVTLNATVAFQVKATQQFGVIESFKWSLDGDTAWDDSALGFPADHKVFTAVPKKFSQAATFDLYFYVRDGEGNEVRGMRKLTVSTQVPKITSLEKDAEITAGDSVAFAGVAEVNSGALKKFTWNYGDGTPAFSGALNAAKAAVAGGHRFAAAGSFTVTLTVEDDAGATVSDRVSVKVNPKSGPKPPFADAGKDTSILLGTRVDLRGSATDPDGTVAKLEWSIDGAAFNPTKGDTSITPSAIGTMRAILRATDNENLTDLDTIDVTISKSQPPKVVSLTPKDTTISIGDSLAFAAKASSLVVLKNFSWDFESDGTLDEAGLLSDTAATIATGKLFPSAGIFTITVKVGDELGGTANKQVVVTVEKDPPLADAGKDTTVPAGTRVNLHGKATDLLGRIVKKEWRIGTGAYTVVSGLDTGFIAPAVGGIAILCYFRVTDDDNQTDEDTVQVLVSQSDDATLSALAVSSGTLAPVFAFGTTVYAVSVINTVASITVTPTSANAASTIKVNGVAVASGSASGALALEVGVKAIVVEVTAQNGAKKEYNVTVTREGKSVNTLSALVTSAGTLSPVFDAATLPYTVVTEESTTTITATVTAGSNATLKINGTTTASGAASAVIDLASGTTTSVPVVVTAENGTNRTYSIVFMRTGWLKVGSATDVDRMDDGKIVFDDTVPYIGYNIDGFGLSVKKRVGGVWTLVGAANFTGGNAAYFDIKFNAGVPYVSFADRANGDKASVMKFNGTAWVSVGARGFSTGAVYGTCLAFSATGVPYITYPDGGNGDKVVVRTFDGMSWSPVGASFPAEQFGEPKLVFHGSTLCLGFVSEVGGKAVMYRLVGTAWVQLLSTTTIPDLLGSAPQFGVAGDGYLYVAYTAQQTYSLVIWRYGGASPAWTKVSGTGLPASTDDFQMFFGAATPYILYDEGVQSILRQVSQFNGTGWTKVTSKLWLNAESETYPNFAVSKGVPWVLYRYAVSKYVVFP